MKSGYDQFFKSARHAAEGKPPAPAGRPRPSAFSKKKKKPIKFPIFPLMVSVVGFVVAYVGYENYEKIQGLLSRVEISLFATAGAEETKAAHADKTPLAESTTFTKPTIAEPTGEELNHLMKLAERKKELDAREEELNRMETELSKQKEELEKKVADLERMRSSISSMLEERVKADDQKINTLVEFYSNMKAPQAAKVFETIDEDLAVQILGRMKKKNAAEVLNLMKPEKAQMFTEKFSGYKRNVASQGESKAQPDEPTTPAPTVKP